jgi:hypothetical protein
MAVREVVIDRDMRSSATSLRGAQLDGYYLRRAASVLILACRDAVAVLLGGLAGPLLLGSLLGIAAVRPDGTELGVAIALTLLVAAICGLYGRRSRRHAALSILGGACAVLLVLALFIVVGGEHAMASPAIVAYWLVGLCIAMALRRGYDRVLFVAGSAQDLGATEIVIADIERSRRTYPACWSCAGGGTWPSKSPWPASPTTMPWPASPASANRSSR